jgi:hypothetical protein
MGTFYPSLAIESWFFVVSGEWKQTWEPFNRFGTALKRVLNGFRGLFTVSKSFARFRAVPKGSVLFQKVSKDSASFQRGFARFKRVLNGSKWLFAVPKGFARFKRVLYGSEGLCTVSKDFAGF